MVNMIWFTENGDEIIAKLARVSNPANEKNTDTAPKLIKYLIEHKHWSPFEMASACVEIYAPRDITRQIIRHRSFSFQEFSQRYSQAQPHGNREARLQDTKNRQSSLECTDDAILNWWYNEQIRLKNFAFEVYRDAIGRGIAKEVARVVLPEGLTESRLYMTGTIRSWLHYLELRTQKETQLEHRMIAFEVRELLHDFFPHTLEAFFGDIFKKEVKEVKNKKTKKKSNMEDYVELINSQSIPSNDSNRIRVPLQYWTTVTNNDAFFSEMLSESDQPVNPITPVDLHSSALRCGDASCLLCNPPTQTVTNTNEVT